MSLRVWMTPDFVVDFINIRVEDSALVAIAAVTEAVDIVSGALLPHTVKNILNRAFNDRMNGVLQIHRK